MARFKNISKVDVHIGRADGPVVAAGAVTSVPGDVVEELDDAYIVGPAEDPRAWPKATWELLQEATTSTSTSKDK